VLRAGPGAGNNPRVTRSAQDRVVQQMTVLASPPLVPELVLHLATPQSALWTLGRRELDGLGLGEPFWAFAWAGGQALARWILDHPAHAAGQVVLDVGSGCGVVALAAALAGAARVVALDLDPWCAVAVDHNARTNGVTVHAVVGDVCDVTVTAGQVILAADVCYDHSGTAVMTAWLARAAAAGARVILADAGRGYFCPTLGWSALARLEVPVHPALEDTDLRAVDLWTR
jgi:predicted nicotinamide N-methyase